MRVFRLYFFASGAFLVFLLGYVYITVEYDMTYCTRLLSPYKVVAAARGFFDGTSTVSVATLIHEHNFRKMTLLGFEEVYFRDPKPRKTTCQQSLRNSKDPKFQEAFIPNIQLFMHKGHLNITEWNRLAHFNNPFGFMGYNYKVVKQTVDLIPKLKDNQLLPVPAADKQGCIHCAVVATGGILRGSKMGKEIDSHDYVFRMSGAVIRGYEEDVGTRTSVYVHSATSVMTSFLRFQNTGFKDIPLKEGIRYVLIPEGLWDFHFLNALFLNLTLPVAKNMEMPVRYLVSHFDDSRYYVLHPDFLRYIRNRHLKSWHLNALSWHVFRPTIGAFSLLLAVHACDTVDAYGFITIDHGKYPKYYFEENDAEVAVNYDHRLEMDLLERLHNSKVINLYQRKEGTQL